MSDLEDLNQKIEDELFDLMANAPTQAAKDAAGQAFIKIQEKKILDAISDLEKGTGVFLSLIDDLTGVIEKMGPVGDSSGKLTALRNLLADSYGEFRSDKGLPNSSQNTAEAEQPTTDESSEKPSQNPKPISQAGVGPKITSPPRPTNSKDYAALSDEYIRCFMGADFKNDQAKQQVARLAQAALAHKDQYEQVGGQLGIPWWFIAGIHMLESNFNFETHLHNGDSLVRRTVRVPTGRPAAAPAAGPGRRYTWVESATDALRMKKFDNQTDWSLARALYRWETYNGWGYRSRGVPTPYLWSFSTVYRAGKFVADHQFSDVAVSKQCGAAVLLKFLSDNGKVDLGLDFVDEPEAPLAQEFDHDAQQVDADHPTVDGPLPDNGDFTQFINAAIAAGKLPALRHFKPGDFLVKGGANAANGLNTDPPRALWPNVLDLIKVVDEFRERIGHPVVLNSVYRSEAYNRSVGGVSGSQHKKFQAADIRAVGFGNPQLWAQKLKELRAANFFHGGIGVYNTFVHVDVRGWDANW